MIIKVNYANMLKQYIVTSSNPFLTLQSEDKNFRKAAIKNIEILGLDIYVVKLFSVAC